MGSVHPRHVYAIHQDTEAHLAPGSQSHTERLPGLSDTSIANAHRHDTVPSRRRCEFPEVLCRQKAAPGLGCVGFKLLMAENIALRNGLDTKPLVDAIGAGNQILGRRLAPRHY